MKIFDNTTLLITGGTGSFGNQVLQSLIKYNFKEIRIFSRDEKKQDDMRRSLNDARCKFYLGDVRDQSAVDSATAGVDFIFHAAALKQVPSCEFYPMEAVKTNIIGTDNVLSSAIRNRVQKVICLSTDKAVYPINAMGMSKSLMEKVLVARSREKDSQTIICGTRYGNVMGSRGSVIPLFIKQILNNQDITITNEKMTRFIMSLNDAVDLVLYAFDKGNPGDIFVQKSPASSISDLASALIEIYNVPSIPIKIIGNRHGEKMYETLVSKEEMISSEDLGDYFRIKADSRDLNYEKYFDSGSKVTNFEEYNSNNTKLLTKEELIKLLTKEGFSN